MSRQVLKMGRRPRSAPATEVDKRRKRRKKQWTKSREKKKKEQPKTYILDFQDFLNKKNYQSEQWFNLYLDKEPTIVSYERNKQLGNYFLDFFFEDIKVIVEIDGKYHNTPEQIKKDRTRDSHLKALGFMIYRIPHSNDTKAKQVIKYLKDHSWTFKTTEKKQILLESAGNSD